MNKLILSWGRLSGIALGIWITASLQFAVQENILANMAQNQTTCTLVDYAAGRDNTIVAQVNCADGSGVVNENTAIVRLMKNAEPASCLRYKDNVIRCPEQK